MLGTLAKWLRILGVDAEYFGCEGADDKLIEYARDEGRILITRDRGIYESTKRTKGIKVILIRSLDIESQLKEVMEHIDIDESLAFTRCIVCNVPIAEVPKSEVEDKVPERIYNSYDEFYMCPSCKRIYWPGSHYDNMGQRIKRLKEGKNEGRER